MPEVPFADLRWVPTEHGDALASAFERVMRSGWYVLGPEVEAFESEWASACGTHHCVGLANGLQAIELALRALGVGPGDEVIVPANTYIATWLAISATGATPVPVEPTPDGPNIDTGRIAEHVTSRTAAVVVVHLYGCAVDIPSVRRAAPGLPIVEDAAQAHGAADRGSRVGALGDVAAWSFYPTKNLGALGDAGAVTTNSADLADRVRVLRNYGSRRKYENEVAGSNSRLDETQAALLRVLLPHLEAMNARRQSIASKYLAELDKLPLALPEAPSERHVFHVFNVLHEQRDALQAALRARGIGTQVFYPIPPHRSGAYVETFGHLHLPITDALASNSLALPCHPGLVRESQAQVIAALTDILR